MTKKDNNPQGLGNDIIEIERIRQSIERHGQHFLNRIFTHREQDYCYKFKDPVPHFAGRFAAKEAIAKAFGTGFGAELSWHDVEILGDDAGKPVVHLSEAAKKKFNQPHILVSISHSTSHATAVALWS
ncbi:MAG TPA: holo-ACP synthase [Chlamydiales bacterium]|nr:holo-ACP synthase [Chlamydiales bacterium]